MPNITITLTEDEIHALYASAALMNAGYSDNMAVDEEMGDDHYARAHRGLDTLEAKLDKKIQFETDVAYLRKMYPSYTAAEIRRALREIQNND